MRFRKEKVFDPQPGDLCWDNERLCVLVHVGNSEDSPATKMMSQVPGMLKPFGYFLGLENPRIKFGQVLHLGEPYEDNEGEGWTAGLFTRNLDAVEWYKMGRDER